MVFLANQGDTDGPHVCIAHMNCFQSRLRSLEYLCLRVGSGNETNALVEENGVGHYTFVSMQIQTPSFDLLDRHGSGRGGT